MSVDPNTPIANATDVAELDSLLGDLDLSGGDAGVEELIESVDQAITGVSTTAIVDDLELDEEEIRKMEAHIERQEAYEEQEVTTAPAPVAAATTQTVVKPAKTPRAPAAPRVARDLNSVDAKHFVLEGALPTDQGLLDAAKTDTLKLMPVQKKIAEKFENLFTSIAAGRKPSTFVVMAFKLLDSKGTLSSTDLVAAYKTVGAMNENEGYNEGTARSQAGQIMNLFDTVKIATRTKQELALNKNSNIAAALRTILQA